MLDGEKAYTRIKAIFTRNGALTKLFIYIINYNLLFST